MMETAALERFLAVGRLDRGSVHYAEAFLALHGALVGGPGARRLGPGQVQRLTTELMLLLAAHTRDVALGLAMVATVCDYYDLPGGCRWVAHLARVYLWECGINGDVARALSRYLSGYDPTPRRLRPDSAHIH